MLDYIAFTTKYIVFMLVGFYMLFGFYYAHKNNSFVKGFITGPLAFIYMILDWALNIVLIPWFVDLPESPFEVVTVRLARYKYYPDYKNGVWLNRWRLANAEFFCKLLSKADKGKDGTDTRGHCEKNLGHTKKGRTGKVKAG